MKDVASMMKLKMTVKERKNEKCLLLDDDLSVAVISLDDNTEVVVIMTSL